MNYIEHRFSLVVDKTVSQASVKVKRGDTLNRLIINLTDHGYPYHISEDVRAFFVDGEVMNACAVDNCSIIYDLTTQTVGTVGKHQAEIRLVGHNDEVITTAKFVIIVEKTIYDDNQNETVPKNEVDALTGLISEASQLVDDINESLENGDFKGEKGDKGDKGDPGTSINAVIDLQKYGIMQADYTAPFTTEMYALAYHNGVGIQNAIDDARASGLREIVFPEGNYPLCYSTHDYQTVNPIIDASGVNLRGYGAKLYVIYDELDTGLNANYTGDPSLAHAMCGIVIKTDSDVEGFEIVGERAHRTTDNAKYREGSYGIVFTNLASGNKVKNCKIHRFSGDGIGGGTPKEQIASWNHTMTHKTWNGTEWADSTISFATEKMSVYWADISRSMQLGGVGYGYRIWSAKPLKIHCFGGTAAAEGSYIGTVMVRQGEPFYFLEGTSYWYLETTDSEESAPDKTVSVGVSLGYGTHNNVTIEGCEIYANTRGGISNLPSGSIVKDCVIHHNGCAFDGMAAFYDTTQFGLDIEDVYIHEITIDNCLFYGQSHDILYRCDKINILNTVTNAGVRSLTDTIDFYARNSKFYGTVDMNGGISFGKRTATGCYFAKGIPDDVIVTDMPTPMEAVISAEDSNMVLFKDASGNVLFTLDLARLGVTFGESSISESLLFEGDMTAFATDATTIKDKTGRVSMTAKAERITEDGLSCAGGNVDAVVCTWENAPDVGQNICVEIFFTGGVPYHVWRGATGNYTGLMENATTGSTLPKTEAADFISNLVTSTEYINTSGAVATSKSANYNNSKCYKDDDTTANISATNFPDSGIMEYGHIVINLYEDGLSEMYINGYLRTLPTTTVTDFAQWDFSNYTSSFRMWSGPDNGEYRLRTARLYNRCLCKEEIRNNLAYEVNKLSGDSEVVVASSARIVDIELLADKWVGTESPYSQVVTVDGATERSQVDLTPSVEQLAIFYNKDLAFVTENEDGVVTVYAIGQKPENDYVMQATVTEVNV